MQCCYHSCTSMRLKRCMQLRVLFHTAQIESTKERHAGKSLKHWGNILEIPGKCFLLPRSKFRVSSTGVESIYGHLDSLVKMKVKKLCNRLVHFAETSLHQFIIILISPYGLTCWYSCLTTLGHAPNDMMDGFLGISSLICIRGSLSSWQSEVERGGFGWTKT